MKLTYFDFGLGVTGMVPTSEAVHINNYTVCTEPSRRGVEVRQVQVVDQLLRGERDSSLPL